MRMLSSRSRFAALGVAALASITLAACTGAPAADNGSDDGELTVITVTTPLAMQTAPLYLGQSLGFFAEEGIDIQVAEDLGAGSAIEAVVGGQVDMAWNNTGGALQAFNGGADLRLVAVTDIAGENGIELLVKGDSPVNDLADLVGKKIGVLAPSTTCVWLVKASLEDQGLDPDSVEFTVAAPPDHPLLLDSGQIDATCSGDPIKTRMELDFGARAVWDPAVDGAGDLYALPTGGYFVSGSYADENADVIEAFQRAIAKSNAYANANNDELRAALPELLNVSPEVAEAIHIPEFVEEVGAGSFEDLIVEKIIDPLYDWGITPEKLKVDGFIWTP